jgi:DNA-binding response OmpR family regulator
MASILLVEDDPHFLWLVGELLQQDGFTVICAPNAIEAIPLLRREPPDLVVSDGMMPGMDGYQFVRLLRTDLGCARLPVILLSARVHPHDRALGLSAGADVYLSKPFEPSELIAAIHGLLASSPIQKSLGGINAQDQHAGP